MSNQVLLEKAVVASVLHKSLVHLELKFQRYDNICQHPEHCHCRYQHYYHHSHPNYHCHFIIVIIIIFLK